MANRGPDPDDASLFSPAVLPTLRAAADEAIWLLGRGYSLDSAVSIVGGHHQLRTRQRLFLKRAVCSEEQRSARAARRRDAVDGVVSVDAFNAIITLEVALSGGLVFSGYDGALRDLAGLRGSYRLLPVTDLAIDRMFEALAAAPRVEILVDQAMSNSGLLRARIAERATIESSVELHANPDAALFGRSNVVSADALVLDRCATWLPLTRSIVESIPQRFYVDVWSS